MYFNHDSRKFSGFVPGQGRGNGSAVHPAAQGAAQAAPYAAPMYAPQYAANHPMPQQQRPQPARPVPPPPSAPMLRPPVPFTDYGPGPFVVNIEQAAVSNDYYRQTLWTGRHLQSTLMSIPAGGDIGLEVHPDNDQFLRLEEGQGIVQMGDAQNNLPFRQTVFANSAVFVPAGTWHNITNVMFP